MPALAAFGFSLVTNTLLGLADGDWSSDDTFRLLWGSVSAAVGGAVFGVMDPSAFKLAEMLEASIVSGVAAGATYAGGAAINSGADWSQFTGAVVQGMAMGGLSSGAGAFSGIFTQGVFQNAFAQGLVDTAATTGAGIGVSLLSGQDVDWGAVAVQSSLSVMRAFFSALDQMQTNQAIGEGAGRAAAASQRGLRYHSARQPRAIPPMLYSAPALPYVGAHDNAQLAMEYGIACFPWCEAIGMNIFDPQQFPEGYADAVLKGTAASVAGIGGFAALAELGFLAWGGAGAQGALSFGANDLVYGASAGGALRALQESSGGRLLTDLIKPVGSSWVDFSISTMRSHLAAGGRLHFDLTHIADLRGVLAGTGQYASAITSIELRWLQANWASVSANVTFYMNGAATGVPW